MAECEYCGEEFDTDRELQAHWKEHKDELNSHQKSKMKKAVRKQNDEKEAKMRKRKQLAGYGLAGALGLILVGIVGAQLLQGGGSASFNLEGQPMLGQEDAEVTVVEFGDYRCPYCREFETGERSGQDVPSNLGSFEQMKNEFIDSGEVKFYFINFAFLGPGSTDAAVAGECVYDQDPDQFWDFHHALYASQGPETESWVTVELLVNIAQENTENLDYEELRSCIENQDTLSEVRKDRQIGQTAGVSSTPSVYVNGEKVSDWQYSNLAQEIEAALQG